MPSTRTKDIANIKIVYAGGYGGSALGFPLHRHELAWELIYVQQGNITQLVEDQSVDLSRGQFVLHPPGVLHGDVAISDYFLYHLIFTVRDGLELPLKGSDLDGNPIASLLEIIVREWYSGWLQRDQVIRSMAQALEIFLRRVNCQISKSYSAVQVVSEARTVFRKRFREDLEINEVARELGISRSSLYQAFQSVLGRSPQDIIDEYRLKHAVFLLKHSELPVAEIALSCGFCTSSHLSRKLKSTCQLSPLELRHMAFRQEQNPLRTRVQEAGEDR